MRVSWQISLWKSRYPFQTKDKQNKQNFAKSTDYFLSLHSVWLAAQSANSSLEFKALIWMAPDSDWWTFTGLLHACIPWDVSHWAGVEATRSLFLSALCVVHFNEDAFDWDRLMSGASGMCVWQHWSCIWKIDASGRRASPVGATRPVWMQDVRLGVNPLEVNCHSSWRWIQDLFRKTLLGALATPWSCSANLPRAFGIDTILWFRWVAPFTPETSLSRSSSLKVKQVSNFWTAWLVSQESVDKTNANQIIQSPVDTLIWSW